MTPLIFKSYTSLTFVLYWCMEKENQKVLCPECFKGQVQPDSKGEGKCDCCLTEFVYKAPTTIKFK